MLKITPPKWAQSVSYHMAVENSTLFSLNIGDSLTNNARVKEGEREGVSRGGLKEGGYKRRVGGREGGSKWMVGEGGNERGREKAREGM